jgi:hypothetical protein
MECDPKLAWELGSRLLIVDENGNEFDVIAGYRLRPDAFKPIPTILVIQV